MVHPATERDFDTNPALPVDQTARVTRRGLLQSIGVGAATAALTAGGFSADDRFTLASSQINATPPASDHIAPANDPVADLAAALNYDMEAIFTFVRDEVHYESYAGVLRGAKGTLWARAGNSADQATLLAELFAASQIPYRFAFGELGPDQVETLAVLMAPDADLLVSSYTDAIIVGFTPSTVSTASGQASPIPEIGLSDEDQSYLDELASNAEAAFTTARSLLDSHLNIIEEALLNSKVTIPESAFTELPTDEIHRHVWIQTPDGPNWIDYAPALGNHEPRTAPGDVTETFTEVPVDLFHNLTFRIIAEEYFGGTTVRRDAISVTTTSSNVVNEPIAFAVVPPAMFTGVGLAVNQAVTGDVGLLPVLTAKGQMFFASTPVVFGAEGGLDSALEDDATDAGLADGETIALWLAIDLQSPGAELVNIERPILDRLGFDNRTSGTVDFSGIQPVSVIDAFEFGSSIPELMSAHVLHVEAARLPVSYAFGTHVNSEEPTALSILAPCMSAFRDALRVREELVAGATSYIASPQITLTSVSLVDPRDPETGAILTVDLLRHETAAIRISDDSSSSVNELLKAGVLDYVAEHLTVNPVIESSPTGFQHQGLPDAGSIIVAAHEQNIPIVAVISIDDVEAIEAGPEALARIEKALAEGMIVVVPEHQVELGTALHTGWWVIDHRTGRIRDETQDGRGYGALLLQSSTLRFTPLPESEPPDEAAAKLQPFYRRMGKHLDCGYALAAIALGVGGGVFAAATGNALAGAGSAVAITKGIRDANKQFGAGGCR